MTESDRWRPATMMFQEDAPAEPVAVVKIYEDDSRDLVRLETEVLRPTSAAMLERIHLIAAAAERGLGAQERDKLAESVSAVRDALGMYGRDTDDSATIFAHLQAIGNTLVAISGRVGTLAERRIRRAEAAQRGKKEA